jgi:hypothetical protein
MKTRPQATKCSRDAVFLHINRQRALGENMIRGTDSPAPIELIVTAVMVLAVLFSHSRGWL